MAEIRIPISVDAKDSLIKLKQVQQGVAGVGEAAKQTNKEKIGANVDAAPIQSLQRQFRAAKQEVAALSAQFGASSVQAKEAAKRAAELGDKIQDSKLLIDSFNPDAKFKGFENALKGAVGAATALAGAQALFGDKSKATAEALAKVQGALALSQGLNAVLESKDAIIALGVQLGILTGKKTADTGASVANAAATAGNAVATEGYAAAQGTAAVATTASSAALGVFKTALIATGIGVFVVGLGLLIANWQKISDALTNSSQKLRDYKEIQEDVVKNSADEISKLQILYTVTQDQSRSLEERKNATKALQDLYPDYFGNLSQESILAGRAKEAYDDLAVSIFNKARAEASSKKITEIFQSDVYIEARQQLLKLTDEYENYKKSISKPPPSQKNVPVNQLGATSVSFTSTAQNQDLTDFENKISKLKDKLKPFEDRAKDIISGLKADDGFIAAFTNGKGDKTGQTKAKIETVADVIKNLQNDLNSLDIKGETEGINVFGDKIKAIQDAIIKLRSQPFGLKVDDAKIKELKDQVATLRFQAPRLPITIDRKTLEKEQEELNKQLDKTPKTLMISVGFKRVQSAVSKNKEEQQKEYDKLEEAAEKAGEDINQTIGASLVDLAGVLAEGLGNIFSGGSFKDALIGGIGVIAQALVQLGKFFVTTAIQIKAFKEFALKNPILAIGAGIALIAIGSALNKKFSKGFATGGKVNGPGSSTSDSIPAMLSDGEYVIKASTVRKYGTSFFDRLNQGRSESLPILKLAEGGLVSSENDTINPEEALKTYSKALVNRVASVTEEIGNTLEEIGTSLGDELKTNYKGLVNRTADATEEIGNSLDDTIKELKQGIPYRALVNREGLPSAGEMGGIMGYLKEISKTNYKGIVNRAAIPSISEVKAGQIPGITENFAREVPYIASTVIAGQDLRLVLNRADSRFKSST